MFSIAVTWPALSPSLRPAPVSSRAPLASAAACAPSRIFTKNGLVSVFVMRPMTGGDDALPVQPLASAATSASRAIGRAICRAAEGAAARLGPARSRSCSTDVLSPGGDAAATGRGRRANMRTVAREVTARAGTAGRHDAGRGYLLRRGPPGRGPRVRPVSGRGLTHGAQASAAHGGRRARHPVDGPVAGREGLVQRGHRLRALRRLLRDVLRGRRDGVARARPDAHGAQQRRRGGGAARRHSREGGRGLPAPARAARLSRRDLRAGGGSEAREGHRAARGGGDDHAGRRLRRRPARRRAQQLPLRALPVGTGPTARMLGVAAADVSTGEFRLALAPRRDADAWLARLSPREVLVARGARRRPRAARAGRRARHRARGVGVRRGARARRPRAPVRRALARGLRARRRRTTPRSARRARCCATCARCSRAGCRTSRGPSSSAAAARCRSTR